MSDQKYTPMQILRDNIKLEIEQAQGFKNVQWVAAVGAYNTILSMIEGNSLGKPLLEQEAELLNEIYENGVEYGGNI